MRQFDILENPNVATRRHAPFVVVLQSHHLDALTTVLLAPLINDALRTMSSVDVPVEFRGQPMVLAIAESAGVLRQGLGRTLGSASAHEDEIRRAFERLLTGF